MLRWLLALPILLVLVLIVVVNFRLHLQPRLIVEEGDSIQYEVLKELRGLKAALAGNADVGMQNIYPEGYVFLNAVYGLAWSSFLREKWHGKYFDEGHAEIQKAWMKLNSAEGRSPFSNELSLPYGSFYNGWSSYLLGSKLRLENASMRTQEEIQLFREQCRRIAEAIGQKPFPSSYEGGAWPADVLVCVASLSLHDKLFGSEYKMVIGKWLEEVKEPLDVRGMIPHSVQPGHGKADENARGSSMALMLLFLHDIDLQFAREQFDLFKANFIDTTLGLTAIREYPKGDSGTGDVDSGPVIMGYGGAATIVGMQALSLFGEHDLSLRVRSTIEAMAFPLESRDHKRYFLGMLPMADAFITWGHAGMNMPERAIGFLEFHLYSVVAFVLLSILFWISIVDKRPPGV